MTYTGHKTRTMPDGQNIVDYIRKGAIQICSLHAMARLFSDLAMTED